MAMTLSNLRRVIQDFFEINFSNCNFTLTNGQNTSVIVPAILMAVTPDKLNLSADGHVIRRIATIELFFCDGNASELYESADKAMELAEKFLAKKLEFEKFVNEHRLNNNDYVTIEYTDKAEFDGMYSDYAAVNITLKVDYIPKV